MSQHFIIGSFNCHNLFERSKLLNLSNNQKGVNLLEKAAILKEELCKKSYDAQKIMSLYNELKSYIDIVEIWGKLFKRKGYAIVGLEAKGVDDWYGYPILKRENFTDATIKNTARVISNINSDIICVVEVENRPALEKFSHECLQTSKYYYNMLIDGNDNRGIDVGILSRFEIGMMKSNIHLKKGKSHIFSRDCLEVEILLPSGKKLWMFLNHFKSKLGDKREGDARRKLQAMTVSEILTSRYDLKNDLVVVAGDFNDTPDSPSLKPLLETPNLFDVLQNLQPEERWTYFYKSPQQIDYILVSRPLHSILKRVGVERGGIYNVEKVTKGAIKRYTTITKTTEAASDHGAVWAEFEI